MTTSQPSNSESSSYLRLDERIQRWIWSEGWESLRAVQEEAIPAILNSSSDVIISAGTASGKTEAAFFPILSNMLATEPEIGSVIYVSPLKALINDQWTRLSALCESLEIPVIPWHGDISSSRKTRFTTNPGGVLLITPESLEALFVTRGSAMPAILKTVRYVVVDELHAFIGVERGKQLQSLMNRIDLARGEAPVRVGLSATLGNMRLAAEFLSPGDADMVQIINPSGGETSLRVGVKAYEVPQREKTQPKLENAGDGDAEGDPEEQDENEGSDLIAIVDDLYRTLRDSNNLVFPNSRGKVEYFADKLRRRCEADHLPNRFWPHHGNLSKALREETEQALKDGSVPATAICTSTLELGIDIGAVKSVAQIGPPPSVASLRQRLGRSGRRKGESATLRVYVRERQLTADSSLLDCLHQGLIQTIAVINLLLRNWFEPPRVTGLHFSTLVHQILSVIAERGGTHAAHLYRDLVSSGTFAKISRDEFVELLRGLGEKDLIMQESSGLLLHGGLGERLVNNYGFYSVFMSDDEFRIVSDGRSLGSLPISRPLLPEQAIIFGGRRWRVAEINSTEKVIYVRPDRGGSPPPFEGNAAMVHDEVRKEMRRVLAASDSIPFIDARAQRFVEEARRYYLDLNLATTSMLSVGGDTLLFTWLGDWVNDALVLMLQSRDLQAENTGVAILVDKATPQEVANVLRLFGASGHALGAELLANAQNIEREKWDWAVPRTLLERSYASSYLDLAGALEFAKSV